MTQSDIPGLDAELESSLVSADLDRIDETAIELSFGFADVAASAGTGIAPEIPIVRLLVALGRATKSVSTALLTRKIVRFLTQLQTIEPHKREAFLRRLEGGDRERIIGDLLLVLERHDTLRKSEIQGKLFAALIREQLTKREYLDLTHATSAVNVDALPELRTFYADALEWDVASAQVAYSFAFLQLVGVDNSKVGAYGGGGPAITKVPLGQKFIDIVFS